MSKLADLEKLGQSVWFDFIRRSLITSGELKELIEKGVRGITSNPAIFEKAIAGSNDYDADIKKLSQSDKSIDEIYEALAFEDIGPIAVGLREHLLDLPKHDGVATTDVDEGKVGGDQVPDTQSFDEPDDARRP